MKRTNPIDPSTTFEPSPTTKWALVGTRKTPIEMGCGDHKIIFHGLYRTDHIVTDAAAVGLAAVLECYSLYELSFVGAFEHPAAFGSFAVCDAFCAVVAHAGAAQEKIYLAHRETAENQDERNWATAHQPRCWCRAIRYIGYLGLLASGLVKSAFFLSNAEVSAAIAVVPAAYAAIIYLHAFHTGYFGAYLRFRWLLGHDWRKYCRRDPDMRYVGPRRMRFHSEHEIECVRVNRQGIVHVADDEYELVVHGLLQDVETLDLADAQKDAAAKADVLHACYKFALQQLNFSATQDIAPLMPASVKAAAHPYIATPLLPLLMLLVGLGMTGCAKPKQKAADIHSVDIVLVTAQPLNKAALPADLAELLSPFTSTEGQTQLSNLRAVFPNTEEHALYEANAPFDPKAIRPSLLNRLLGSSVIALDTLKTSWLENLKAKWTAHRIEAADYSAEPTPINLARAAMGRTASSNVFSYHCGDLGALDSVPAALADAHGFQAVVDRCTKQEDPAKTQPLVILYNLSLPATLNGAAADAKPTPTRLKAEEISPRFRDKLPAVVRTIIEKGETHRAATVYFDRGSVELPAAATQDLERVAAEMRGAPNAQLIIVGYADRQGSYEHNLRLSRERSLVVAKAMQHWRIGVAAALGLGDALEIDGTGTVEGQSLNRRVDMIIVERTSPSLARQP